MRSLAMATTAALLLTMTLPLPAAAELVPLRDAATGRVISLQLAGYQASGGATAKAALTAEQVTAQSLAFLGEQAGTLGVSAVPDDLVALPAVVDKLGLGHQRFALRHGGVPVYGGEVYVHVDPRAGVYYATVKGMGEVPATMVPAVTAEEAREAALGWGAAIAPPAVEIEADNPDLLIMPRRIAGYRASSESRLAWRVRVAADDPMNFDEECFVDASTGEVLLHLTMNKSLNRRIYDCSKYLGQSGCYIDSPALSYNYWHGRSESAPQRGPDPRHEYPLYFGSTDTDLLHSLFDAVHGYWLNTFGRNGANNQGGLSKSPVGETKGFVHVDNPYPTSCPDAWYSGSSSTLQFCRGMVTPDVVGHEYAHGVTEFSFVDQAGSPVGLIDTGETGALDESFSDMHGEGVEKLVLGINDWRHGIWQDVPAGTYPSTVHGLVRDLREPWSLQDPNRDPPLAFPAKFSSTDFYCGEVDYGGRHHNSTVPSYALYLLSEGGQFNGCTVAAIGLETVQQILYRAWTTYFTRTVTFNEAYFALQQAAADLYPQEVVDQVRIALQAVEMDQPGYCSGIPAQTPACAGASAVPGDLVAPGEGASIRYCGPNPSFGPATIEYALAREGNVEVAVFDVAGRRVAIVVAEQQERGLHQATWRDPRVPSGHYVVRLTVDGRAVATRKLMVIR